MNEKVTQPMKASDFIINQANHLLKELDQAGAKAVTKHIVQRRMSILAAQFLDVEKAQEAAANELSSNDTQSDIPDAVPEPAEVS
jgi:hypothetical protein